MSYRHLFIKMWLIGNVKCLAIASIYSLHSAENADKSCINRAS